MTKAIKVMLLSMLLTLGLHASDLLSKATGGTITESSVGAAQLDDVAMGKIKGGYLVQAKLIADNEVIVFAQTTIDASELGVYTGDEIRIDETGNMLLDKSGICGLGETRCYMYPDTKTHYTKNINRLNELLQVVQDPTREFIAYSVKRNIGTDSRGKKFVYFSYSAGYVDIETKSYHRLTPLNSTQPHPLLNNNSMIIEMRDKYKDSMEHALGGYTIRN
ncbi:hypothetical protein U5B43_10290 [Campylobacter sp. 9BO]|uniref:hypothetical protein n=1 Tax=Campylobacter sp. 9BO TaxID=3424759 RepID=UPI003D3479F0